MAGVPHEAITYRVIGCAMRVRNKLGPGLKEGIYQRALSEEMKAEGLTFEEGKPIEIFDRVICLSV